MSVIQYSTALDGKPYFYLDPMNIEDADEYELEELAQLAADDYWRHRDGWESKWPIDFELFSDGKSIGIFNVDMEFSPEFTAKRKKG